MGDTLNAISPEDLSVLHRDARDAIAQALPLFDALFAALRSSPDAGGRVLS